MNILKCALLSIVIATASAVGQSGTATAVVGKSERNATIDALVERISSGYVLPENRERIVQALRSANRAGEYDEKAPKDFAEAVNGTLHNASHDKHLTVFYQPVKVPSVRAEPTAPKERFNYGFGKLERLRGNIAFLEIASFADLTQQSTETVAALLSTLANYDAVIIDLRRNGGGSTPMMAFVASYFFEPAPVHLTDIYWRDINQTSQFWTDPFVLGRRASGQPLYLLTSAQTFSAAEDFCYSLQNLKRAIVVGETTSGGAHSGRGLQRLSDSFAAFIPVGRSISPITKTNWEGTGVTPNVETRAEASVGVATELALKSLIDKETDPQWRQGLQ